jgi:hypothetical protein
LEEKERSSRPRRQNACKPPNPSKKERHECKKGGVLKERQKERKAKSRIFHLDILVTVFVVFIVVVFVIFVGLVCDFFLDGVRVDIDGSLVFGVEFVVHGKLTTTHESSDLFNILFDESLRLMQTLFEGFE